jgi:RNA binding exosome subunit
VSGVEIRKGYWGKMIQICSINLGVAKNAVTVLEIVVDEFTKVRQLVL